MRAGQVPADTPTHKTKRPAGNRAGRTGDATKRWDNTIFLRVGTVPLFEHPDDPRKRSLEKAINHNRRLYQPDNADPARTRLNYALGGPLLGADVYPAALAMIAASGTTRRANASIIELLFSLAPDHGLDQNAYFERCHVWAAERFSEQNIISADVHLDQEQPHIHVLILPLLDGKLQPSAILGGLADLYAMRASATAAVQSLLGDPSIKTPIGDLDIPAAKRPAQETPIGDFDISEGNSPALKTPMFCIGDLSTPKNDPKAARWLSGNLDRIQSAKALEAQAAERGYSMADLIAASLAIGVRVVRVLGVDYWLMAQRGAGSTPQHCGVTADDWQASQAEAMDEARDEQQAAYFAEGAPC